MTKINFRLKIKHKLPRFLGFGSEGDGTLNT